MKFGNHIKLHRWFNQEYGRAAKVARTLGVSRTTLTWWTSGKKIPTDEHQFALELISGGSCKRADWPAQRPRGRRIGFSPKNKLNQEDKDHE